MENYISNLPRRCRCCFGLLVLIELKHIEHVVEDIGKTVFVCVCV